MNLNIKAKSPKRDDNIKMRDLYHIQCDPYLGLGKCDMRRIPCACQSYQLSLEQLWEENFDADKQPSYSGNVGDCKYAYILGAYNRSYIVYLVVSHTASIDTYVDYIEEAQETIIDSISSIFAEHIFISNYGTLHTDNMEKYGYYIVQWKSIT